MRESVALSVLRYAQENYGIGSGAEPGSSYPPAERIRIEWLNTLGRAGASRERETAALVAGGRSASRAYARLTAITVRNAISGAETVLRAAGDEEGAELAREAGEALTALMSGTYDGPPGQTFACKR